MTNEVMTRRAALTGLGLASLGAAAVGASAASASTADKPLAGKTALVTGARNNQGRAYATALAAMGANVVLHYHRAETADQMAETQRLVEAEGVQTILFQGDLGDSANFIALYGAAEAAFGGVDIAVHTAGAIVKSSIAETADADLELLINSNIRTTFYSMREAARRVRDGGRIISIGTSLTAGTAPGYAPYAGTKAPVEEFTRILAREVGARGITVNVINPGPLDNPFFHAAETEQSAAFAANLAVDGRLGTEADIVPVVEMLASTQGQWTNGQNLFINGGYLAR